MFADLRDKRVLVTGASGGIGSSITKLFGEYGARVGLHYHKDQVGAEKALSAVEKKGGQGIVIQGDLLIERDRNRLIEQFLDAFGGIDVLINNAGAPIGDKHYLEVDSDSWQKTFTLNAEAPFFLAQKVFPVMKAAAGGRIINISSIAVKYGGSDMAVHYGAAKAALENITIALAKRGAPDNILVNTIRAGVIDTDFHRRHPKPGFAERIKMIPVDRMGRPEEIADMALFLASDRGAFITGQTLGVTGGE